MKKIILVNSLLLASLLSIGQSTLTGTVNEKNSNKVVQSATILLSPGNIGVIANKNGEFSIYNLRPGNYQLEISSIGFRTLSATVTLASGKNDFTFEMEPVNLFLQPVEIKGIRAADLAPFTKTNITKKELEKSNLGQDLPFLLNYTPSVVINSDAGNGIGYTGINIRGSDATRINMTLNGIPYNDPESQGIFLVDLPDFASSVGSIQIQRGVGTSSNGAGAFGATLNLSTNEFNEKAYGEVNNSFGSYSSRKHTLKAGTGLLNNHFTVDARLSKIKSDGYIDRAFSDLNSYYLSSAYYGKKSSLRLNVFSGSEITYQAWNGVAEVDLKTNRRANSSGTEKPGSPYENETDNYKQDHYQFFVNHEVNSQLSFNTALYYTKGRGFYEQYKANQRYSRYGLPNFMAGTTTFTRTDLIRQLWLDNNLYGGIFSVHLKKSRTNYTLGGGYNTYDGDHFGELIWGTQGIPFRHRWYDNNGRKNDGNIYLKAEHNLDANWSLFGDLQYRHVDYRIDGFRNNAGLMVDTDFDFFNPKAGVSFNDQNWFGYFSYSQGNKEPNRNDFEAGVTQQPKAERLHDLELGLERRNNAFTYGFTTYYMNYTNQLVLTGKINDVGAYTRVNTPNSYRLGIELQGKMVVTSWFNSYANLTLSRNKIKSFTEFADDFDLGGQIFFEHRNTDISYSPNVVGSAGLNFLPVKNMEVSLLSKYVARQFLDNTQNKSRSLNPYYVQDARLIYNIPCKTFKSLQFVGQVNNIFSNLYEANGYTFSFLSGGDLLTENFFFPMAPINFMAGLNIKF